MPPGAPVRPRAAPSVAAFSVAVGLSLFVVHQLFKVVDYGRELPRLAALTYPLTFLLAGAGAAAALALVRAVAPAAAEPGRLVLAAGLYGAGVFVAAAWRLAVERRAGSLPDLLLAAAAVAALLAGRSVLRRRGTGPGAWLVLAGWTALVFAWATAYPERATALAPALAHALFLGLLLVLLGRTWTAMALPRWPLRVALPALLVLVLASFRAGDLWLYRTGAAPVEVAAADRGQRPSILLVVWDTARRDHLSLYGYERETTPYLTDRAPESRVFAKAIATSPWTLPSHASLLTGLSPQEHGAHFVCPTSRRPTRTFDDLPPEAVTLPELLRARGYATAAISANRHAFTRRTGLGQGFSRFDDRASPRSLERSHLFDLNDRLVELLRASLPWRLHGRLLNPYRTAELVNAQALDWIDSRPLPAPFFLMLNYCDAHEPFNAPGELRHRYPGFQPDLVRLTASVAYAETCRRGAGLTPRERDHLVSQYDGALLYLDQKLQALEDGLRARGLYDDTLIVVTSDHGEHFGEHGLVGHGRDLYAETLDVPLVVKYPGGRRAGHDNTPVDSRRVFHLLLEAAGVEAPGASPAAEPISQCHCQTEGAFDHPTFAAARHRSALLLPGYKFIQSSDGNHELYDLEADRGELHNLVSTHAEVTRRALARASALLGVATAAGDEGLRLSEEERQQLRALGYVQ